MSKMLKGVLLFGAGIYTGIYMAQNYPIDKVEDPKVLFMKLKDWATSSSSCNDPKDGKK